MGRLNCARDLLPVPLQHLLQSGRALRTSFAILPRCSGIPRHYIVPTRRAEQGQPPTCAKPAIFKCHIKCYRRRPSLPSMKRTDPRATLFTLSLVLNWKARLAVPIQKCQRACRLCSNLPSMCACKRPSYPQQSQTMGGWQNHRHRSSCMLTQSFVGLIPAKSS